MKNNLLFKLYISIFIFILSNTYNCFADSISIGASPSFIKDVKLSSSKPTYVKFTVANTSSFAKSLPQSALKNFDTNINLKIDSKIIPSKDIHFSDNNFILKPSEKKEITVTLPPIKDIKLDKEDNIFITVSGSNEYNLGINYIPSIKIPLYIYTNDNLKSSATLNSVSITDNLNLDTQDIKAIKKVKKYVGDKEIIEYKFPKNKQILLKDTIVYDKNNISNKKYIHIDSSIHNNTSITSINFNTDNIEFIINKDTKVLMYIENKNIINVVRKQIEDISKILSNPPTINYLLNNILVYENPDYILAELFIDTNISNTGEKTIFPEGKITLLSKDNVKITEIPISSTIISPNETKSFLSKFFIPTNSDLDKEYKVIVSIDLNGKQSYSEQTLYLNLKKSHNNNFILVISLIIIPTLLFIFSIKRKTKNK